MRGRYSAQVVETLCQTCISSQSASMAAASYYNDSTHVSQPPTGPQSTYGNDPHNLPSTHPHTHLYPSSAYNKPNESPAHASAPLLDKPPPTTTYCTNWTRARRSWKVTVVKDVVHIAGWVAVSVVYRCEKGLRGLDDDLICGGGRVRRRRLALLRGEVGMVVDFGVLCGSLVRFCLQSSGGRGICLKGVQ